MDKTMTHAVQTKPRHETREASARNVLIFLVAMMLSVAVSFWLGREVFRYDVAQEPSTPATPFQNVRELPPAPRLQVTPRQDLKTYLAHEKVILDSYGWVDRKDDIVRIPIDRAMDLQLQQGLPVRSASPAQTQAPLKPGEVQQYTVPEGYTPEN